MGNFTKVFKSYPRTFWTANTLELFERLSYYGVFILLANYITGSTDIGALGFSQTDKAVLMGSIGSLVYLFPIITGSIADKFGFKRVLIVAFFVLGSGYFMLSLFKSFWSLYFVLIYIAAGAALFKPVISATISKTTNDENSSIGFGIFYMMVNIGSLIGPFIGAKLKIISYDFVFMISAASIGINMLLVILFYKEPGREKSEESLIQSIVQVLLNIIKVLKDWKFMIFIVLIGGFWSMYWQLFYTVPVFIEQWVDLEAFYNTLFNWSPAFARMVGSNGSIASEMLVNMDSFYIIVFQVLVSYFVMKFKPLNAMISGITICSIGIGLMMMTNNPLYMVSALLIFAWGEMASSPKITEYIGKIAPKEKVALYMGFSFFPHFIGNLVTSFLSGPVYQNVSDKLTFTQLELSARGIVLPEISESFTINNFYLEAASKMNMNTKELTLFLWDKYEPSNIWIIFSAIGISTALLLFIYDKLVLSKK